MTVTIDTDSEPGSYRSANDPDASCAACKQTTCDHPDMIYNGKIPLPEDWQK